MRISGPSSSEALRALAGGIPPPRRAQRTRLTEPASGALLDDGLCLWFPAPHSFTGEDVAELHIHGGRATVAAVLSALGGMDGLRPAEPGEFTRRAFDNGKLDLTAVEGLADLVAAETEAQRRQALRQLDGALGRMLGAWRTRLVGALAHVEAAIDFVDEDLPPEVWRDANREITRLADEITQYLDNDRGRGERLRDGLQIAVLGPPNVGKSSLINELAGREVAIVAATAGTTRDIIEVALDLGGYPAVIVDTAGLRATQDPVEAEGVRRARMRAESADLKLVLCEAAVWPALDGAAAALAERDAIVVVTKVDLARPGAALCYGGLEAIALSVRTGEGMSVLLQRLQAEAERRLAVTGMPALTRARHRAGLDEAVAGLRRAAAGGAPELVAEELRLAARAIGRITGRVEVDELLGVIFSEFCIGK